MTVDALFTAAAGGSADALAELTCMAADGDIEAAFRLGVLHDVPDDKAIPIDAAAARVHYERAALRGHALAQHCLACMCNDGEGGARDLVASRGWFRAAAEQGILDAVTHYARMLQTGRGGPQDLEEAADWYWRAAQRGDELAATNLGIMHYERELNDSSDERAIQLFHFSAERLDGLAHLYLGEMVGTGRGVEPHSAAALSHFCIAVLLLPPGVNQDAARARKESMLDNRPELRTEFETHALGFIRDRQGQVHA